MTPTAQRNGFLFFSCHPMKCVPGYLNATLHDECGELGHHKVHTFEAGLFEFEDLLFDNRLKRQVGGEKPRSERSRVRLYLCEGVEGSRQILRSEGQEDSRERKEKRKKKSPSSVSGLLSNR